MRNVGDDLAFAFVAKKATYYYGTTHWISLKLVSLY